MSTPNHDPLFRQIAAQYAVSLGKDCLQEAEALRQSGETAWTDGAERRFRHAVRGHRLKRHALSAALLTAACLALLLLSPLFATLLRDGETNAPSIEEPSADPLPLDFALPANLTVKKATLDRGKSVYLLSDTAKNDVVLTMEPLPTANVYPPLPLISVEGADVYAHSGADYSLLTFDKDGVLYTLTCRYDAHTLVALSEAIL